MPLVSFNSPESSPIIMLSTVACTLVLALIHLHANKLKFLNVIPHSRWLSMASGVSVAYVFSEPDVYSEQLGTVR